MATSMETSIIIIAATILTFSAQVVCGCSFSGLLSSCPMTVGGLDLSASARINHCHRPIDITFLLQSNNNNRSSDSLWWKYTYVTSNQPESQEIPGSDRRIMMHIFARVERRRKQSHGGVGGPEVVDVSVKAQFLVDGQTTPDLTFLDETVRVEHFEDCAYLAEEEAAGRIAMGAIMGVTGLSLLGLALLCLYHRRRRRPDDEAHLVSNMEGRNNSNSSNNSSLPQTSTSSNDIIRESSVKYVVPRESENKGEEHELKVWVSTTEGLKPAVERQASNSSVSTASKSTNSPPSIGRVIGDEVEPPPPALPERTNANPCSTSQPIEVGPKMPEQSQRNQKEENQPSPEQTRLPQRQESTPVVDRSLGAIPKSCRRQSQAQGTAGSNAISCGNSDTASNSSSSVISR